MLPALRSPEIIFGLCSPIGTDNLRIASLIEQELRQYGYSVINLKVTDIMKDVYVGSLRTVDSPLHRRYDSYIKYANAVRDQFKRADALAMLCSARIRRVRREQNGQPDAILSSKAFILNQFKRKEEVNSLRQVYGKLFVLISVYSDKQLRTERLARMFSEDARSARVTEEDRAHARALVARDEDEEGVRYGQQLRETFPLADLFLDIDDPPSAQQALRKFLAAFFGSNSESPSREEYGMYIAKSASLRSLDLSRQVGAAIFSQKGEVITLGCNEVPKAGGGTYWTGDQPDARDYIFGQDENERLKRALLADIVRRLAQGEREAEAIVAAVVEDSKKKGSVFRDALVMDLLEYGRAIHAEMSALSDAARLGRSVAHAELYCTTFPCHMCARHIIASGLAQVYFIEPYPKSYAEKFYDTIQVTREAHRRPDTIRFSPFMGVSPVRFRDLYERGRRKDEHGVFVPWEPSGPNPITGLVLPTYLTVEEAFAAISRSTRKAPKRKIKRKHSGSRLKSAR